MDVCLELEKASADVTRSRIGPPTGDVHPVESLYLRLAPILRRIAIRRYDIPPADVDAVVNDVFATYLTRPEAVRDAEKYLVGGVCNAARDYWRERNREVSLEAAEHVSAHDELAGLPERLLLAATLARLREKCRTLLCRYYFEGENTETIACEINTSPGNVLYLLHQCRQRARRIVEAMSQVR